MYPAAVWKDMIFSAAILFAVAVCALVLGPFGPTGFPDPTIIQTVPKPDFFFLWLYTILSFLPENLETPFILIAPILGIAFLLALAVLCRGRGEELAPAAGCCALDHRAGGRLCGVRAPGNLHAVESADAGLERRHRPRPLCARRRRRWAGRGRLFFRISNAATATCWGAWAASVGRRSTAWLRG